MNRPKKDFNSMSDQNLAIKALIIITAMTANANYTGIAFTAIMAAIQTAYDEYNAALSVAQYGTSAAKANKRAKKKILQNELSSLVDLVAYTTPNDRAKYLTTGLTIGEAIPLPVTLTPLKKFYFRYVYNSGSIELVSVKSKGTVAVVTSYAVGPAITESTIWKACGDSKNGCVINNLPPGETIWGRATSIGRRGQSIVSDPIKAIII